MWRLLATVSLAFVLIPVVGQLTDREEQQLRMELTERVNSCRADVSSDRIVANKVLQRAAEMHSTYMRRNKKLSHRQRKKRARSALDRVRGLGGTEFKAVGENILYIRSINLHEHTIAELADRIFGLWRNSTGHYRNMIKPTYTHSDFGFAYDPGSKRLYATQILAAR
jgi:uncharacterized protein YkwD